MPEEGSTVIEVPSPLTSLRDELGKSSLTTPPSYIFPTPSILFRHRPNAFHPNRFSIGPMHYGKDDMLVTKIKHRYLTGMLSRVARFTMKSEEDIFAECVAAVEGIEKHASLYYEGHDFSAEMGENFKKILLVDGCFIIELFRKYASQEISKDDDDPTFSMSCMLQFLHHDLILLENQIPWLVLETLFNKTRLSFETVSLSQLALIFFATKFSNRPAQNAQNIFGEQTIKHILDLLRLFLVLPSQEIKTDPKLRWSSIHSITRLKEAGVKFKKVTSVSVLDIKFKNGTLEIPSLLIQETTETIFRNLIAYEQCLPHCDPIVTCYAKFLDNLIDTPSDIDILCEEEIFYNWMSPEDASQFFNKLYNDTFVKKFYYSELCDQLNQHCKRWWPRWRAAYVHNYFTKPWAVAAQIYAVIIFVLTFWQTFLKK